MSTHAQLLFHLVFSTKKQTGTLAIERHGDLCQSIESLLQKKDCVPWKLGGTEDHIHILFSMNPELQLSSLTRDIKLGASRWIYEDGAFVYFEGWQEGYAVFSCSWTVRDNMIKYIGNQFEFHQQKTFEEEYLELLHGAEVKFDESTLWDTVRTG